MGGIPENRKRIFGRLQSLISELYPESSLSMWWRMPTWKSEKGWVSLANQKNYVSLYTNGARNLSEFKAAHPEIKTGTGCINFREKDTIPEEAVKQVIRHAMEQD